MHKNKTTSKISVKLVTTENLLPPFASNRNAVIVWAKEEARIYTETEAEGNISIDVIFVETKE